MKKFMKFIIFIVVLAACTISPKQAIESAAVEPAQVKLPNPATVYCKQNGNQLEIRTAVDGSQSGVCIFPDGNTCDEWAYYRGECGNPEHKSPNPVPTRLPTAGAAATLTVGDASGGYLPPGSAEEISDWWGVIKSTQTGTEFDDFFERQDLGSSVFFGIDSLQPEVKVQIEALRDSGKIAHLYGTLLSNVPDYNGSQIQVDRIEVLE